MGVMAKEKLCEKVAQIRWVSDGVDRKATMMW